MTSIFYLSRTIYDLSILCIVCGCASVCFHLCVKLFNLLLIDYYISDPDYLVRSAISE